MPIWCQLGPPFLPITDAVLVTDDGSLMNQVMGHHHSVIFSKCTFEVSISINDHDYHEYSPLFDVLIDFLVDEICKSITVEQTFVLTENTVLTVSNMVPGLEFFRK